MVLKLPLCHKADSDLIPFIKLPSTNKPVQVRAHGDDPGQGRYDAVKYSGFVLRMQGISLIHKFQKFCDIQRKFHIDLRLCAFGHNMHHNVVQPIHIPNPASVLPVTKFTFHNFCSSLYSCGIAAIPI